MSGRAHNARDKYGCSIHNQRGESVCSNGLTIKRESLEREVLRGLEKTVLREEVIYYAVQRMSEEIERRYEEIDSTLDLLHQRKLQIEGELSRLVEAIAHGHGSLSIMAAIDEREKELRAITDRLLEKRPGSLLAALEELRTFAVSRLTDLRGLLTHPESIRRGHCSPSILARSLWSPLKTGAAALRSQRSSGFLQGS